MIASRSLCSTARCSVAWRGPLPMWRIGFRWPSISGSARIGIWSYAKKRSGGSKEKVKTMEEDDAFYVVRKGNLVAIYKSLSDCQAQVSSSVSDPAVGVHKGYALQKEAIEYLTSRGLKSPLYCIDAAHWKDDLVGPLTVCPYQQPGSCALPKEVTKEPSLLKRSKEELETQSNAGLESFLSDSSNKKKMPKTATLSCIIEFDGAAKGNPGVGGAGVIVRKEDGSVISRLREGLGEVTNNVAEYRAVILGMRFALRSGFQKILVQGDSLLVCNQLDGVWKTRDHKLIPLLGEAKELMEKFRSFKICHVLREYNSDADKQANLATHLPCGEVQEDHENQLAYV